MARFPASGTSRKWLPLTGGDRATAREKWPCCGVGKGFGLVLCQSHEWNFAWDSSYCSKPWPPTGESGAGRASPLGPPYVRRSQFHRPFLLVREVHWEAEAVEDQLQEKLDELSVQIHVQPSPGPKAS